MASLSFKHFVDQKLGRFPRFLIYAVLEWMLILVLFVDGFLAFLTNEFAKFFEMPIPCLLCTRIDHLLVHRKPGFYYNESVCDTHKKDVSFLAYCHSHRKLSDIRKMCEQCLLSFATEKDSDCDTYKSLVGILHTDLECFVDGDHKVNLKLQMGKNDETVQVGRDVAHWCSCCGEPLKNKSSLAKGVANHSLAPTSTPRSPFVTLNKQKNQSMELSQFMSEVDSPPEDLDSSNAPAAVKGYPKAASVTLLGESEYLTEEGCKTPNFQNDESCRTPKLLNDEACKTPNFYRGNKFFGIPLTDSATNSPRWSTRTQRKSPLEKSELASEFAEGNSSSEVDPDSIVHRLKRQVRLDRKSLIDLYMELDEERSASAIAANNAMAMITRLQTEKAAVQMEALQYQRMMEEQAEYDQEALQLLKETLAKREEELRELEAELALYREKYGYEGKGSIDGGEECTYDEEFNSQLESSYPEKSECGSAPSLNEVEIHVVNEHRSDHTGSLQEENHRTILDESMPEFEQERPYLQDHLKDLEKRIDLPADEVPSSQSTSGVVTHVDKEKVIAESP